jgi:hypothetical protein
MNKNAIRLALMAACASAMSFATTSASAVTTVCLGGDYGVSTCTASNESKVYLQSASGVTTGYGNIGSQSGSPVAKFTSTDSLDFANGFATIKPVGRSFSNLAITIPDHKFGDIIFDLQLLKNNDIGQNLTIKAYYGTTLEQTFALTNLAHDADKNFIIVATGGYLTEIDLSSTSGIKEAKHFEFSGVASTVGGIPEPSTWAMMLLGFGCLGFAAKRRAGKELAAQRA